jgi:hypothetical protein
MRPAFLALIASLAAAGSVAYAATPDNAANSTGPKTGASAPVTDASLPPNKAPVGAPVRPLTNVPSIVLKGVGGNTYPGEAFFEKARNGTAVRIQSRDVQHAPMPAMIARGDCAARASSLYKLKPVVDGVSITTLPNVSFAQLTRTKTTVRVEQPGGKGDALCGVIQPSEVQTR